MERQRKQRKRRSFSAKLGNLLFGQPMHSSHSQSDEKQAHSEFASPSPSLMQTRANIDYVTWLPVISSPNARQSRFLLAMDYTLLPRDGLGVMDTALEHMMHYYDTNAAELVECEQWQRVCLLLEFSDVRACTEAYLQLFQFFRAIFYVEDLSTCEELWLCAHCGHANSTGSGSGTGTGTRVKRIRINDKRVDAKGNEVTYWCPRCSSVSDPASQRVRYAYRRNAKSQAKRPMREVREVRESARLRLRPRLAETSSVSAHIENLNTPPPPLRPAQYEFQDESEDEEQSVVSVVAERRTPVGPMVMGAAHGVLWPQRSVSAQQHPRQHRQQHPQEHYGLERLSHSKSQPLPSPPRTRLASDACSGASVVSLSASASASASTVTSTVTSVRDGLELCCSVLSNMEPDIKALRQMETHREEVMATIARLSDMLRGIEHSLTPTSTSTSAAHSNRIYRNGNELTSHNLDMLHQLEEQQLEEEQSWPTPSQMIMGQAHEPLRFRRR